MKDNSPIFEYDIKASGVDYHVMAFPNQRAVLVTGKVKPGIVDDLTMADVITRNVARSLGIGWDDIDFVWSEPSWTVDDVGVSRVARLIKTKATR